MPLTSIGPSQTIPLQPLTGTSFRAFGEVAENPGTHNGSLPFTTVSANQGSATKVLDVTHMNNHYNLSSSRKPAKPVLNMFVCKPRKLDTEPGTAKQVFPVKILERHPFTPQTFVPMGLDSGDRETAYLVIVAPTLPLSSSHRPSSSQTQPPYPVPLTTRKRSLKDRLLGARPNPFTNDFAATTTPKQPSSPGTEPKGPGLPDLSKVQAFLARGDQAVTYGPGTWHAPMVVLGKRPVEFVVVQFANGVAVEDCQEVEVRNGDDGEGLRVVVEDDALGISGEAAVKAKL